MNLPQQTLRNMTTEEILSFSETLETIDRLTFSYISERTQKTLQEAQDGVQEKQDEIDDLREQLRDTKEALEKIHKIASEVTEEGDPNYQEMHTALLRIDDIAFEAKEEIVEGLFL